MRDGFFFLFYFFFFFFGTVGPSSLVALSSEPPLRSTFPKAPAVVSPFFSFPFFLPRFLFFLLLLLFSSSSSSFFFVPPIFFLSGNYRLLVLFHLFDSPFFWSTFFFGTFIYFRFLSFSRRPLPSFTEFSFFLSFFFVSKKDTKERGGGTVLSHSSFFLIHHHLRFGLIFHCAVNGHRTGFPRFFFKLFSWLRTADGFTFQFRIFPDMEPSFTGFYWVSQRCT